MVKLRCGRRWSCAQKIDPTILKEIEVFTSKFTWFEIGSEPEKWDPQTRETADHSLPYIFARALVDGPIRVSSFNDEAVRDPALRPLMQKIKVIPDDAIEALLPAKTLIRVVATTADGARHSVEVENPLGHPDNPMQDHHIEEKFMALAEPVAWQRSQRSTRSRAGGRCNTLMMSAHSLLRSAARHQGAKIE